MLTSDLIGMRFGYVAAGLTILLFLFSYAGAQPASGGARSINATINSTAAYIQLVNESGYLIFYPNVTNATGLYNKAVNISASDPAAALTLLSEAHDSAQQQLQQISIYRNDSFVVVAIIFAASALVLYFVMRAPKNGKMTSRK